MALQGSPPRRRWCLDARDLGKHCEEVGRDYGEVTRTINLWTLLARSEAKKAGKRRRFPHRFSVDTPGEAVAELERYEAAGDQYAIVKILDAADLDPVRHYAEEVMAALSDTPVTGS